MSAAAPGASRWPAIRASLLAVALLFHGLAAAPVPHVVTRDDLRNPVSAEEVAAWSRRLAALGIALPPDDLGDLVISVSGAIGRAHRALQAPARPVFAATGTGQGWALFANPDTHPARLEVRGRRDGETTFTPLFRHLDPDATWRAPALTYRRVRGVYDAGGYRSKPRKPYQRFARWIAREALAERPDLAAVEVRTVRTHTTLPGAPPDPTEEVRHVVPVGRRP